MRFAWTLALILIACGGDEPEPEPPPVQGPSVQEVLERHHVEWDAAERSAAITAGRTLLVEHECNRCHTIDDIEPAGRSDHCTSCHQWLKGLVPGHRHYTMLSERYGEDTLLRYQRNIDHYQRVPNLTKVAQRLDPRWIRDFIGDPYDLRPAMEETMVRTNMSDADRLAIARYFAAVAEVADPADGGSHDHPEAPAASRIEEGKRIFLRAGCTTCHTLGNIETGKTQADLEAAGIPARLAPNLRFARERMSRDVLIAWIEDPASLVDDTPMPDMNLSYEDAAKVADFILHADPQLGEPAPMPSINPPAAVDRPVGWEEVKAKLLGRICVHCHMNDHERDLGPGNEGGFGWPGNRLAMRTYETLIAGAADPETGERYSVLVPREGHEHPPIIEVMMLRRIEERRDRVEAFHDAERPAHGTEVLGMPMGLPQIPDDEIALIRAWIAQGCPGPTEVTGMPGITDGFLVPDGPLAVNRGCELRAPSETRPEWSTQPPPEWARPEGPTNMAPSMTEMNVRSE